MNLLSLFHPFLSAKQGQKAAAKQTNANSLTDANMLTLTL